MPRPIVLQIEQFEKLGGYNNVRASEMIIHKLLECVVFADCVILQAMGAQIPWLYDAHKAGKVVYQREPPGLELFNGIIQVLKDGGGDCDDLACWRVAELRVRGSEYYPNGEPAKIHMVKYQAEGQPLLYHIQVRRAPTPQFPDGWIEDPSKECGMKGNG